MGNAQVSTFRTPVPDVTAAGAAWQVNGEAIFVQGLQYFATRDFRIFDGTVMVPVGIYQRVPVYADTTQEPFSVVYVPVGGGTMRTYERPRSGDLAARSGSARTTRDLGSRGARARRRPGSWRTGPRPEKRAGSCSPRALGAPAACV